MRRKILSIVNGTVVTVLAAACTPGSSADRADTAAAPAEQVAITRRDTVAVAASETVVGTAPTHTTVLPTSDSLVVQPIKCTPNTFGPGDIGNGAGPL